MMSAIFPDQRAIFWSVLMAFSPWASTPRVRSVLSAISPIAVTMMSRISVSHTAAVMMMFFQLFDGRAVEKRRRVCGNRDVIQLPKSIVIITTDNWSIGGVVGVTGTPGDGSVGVVGVVWSPEDGLGECGVDHGSRLMVQFAQINFIPRLIGAERDSDAHESQDSDEKRETRHLKPLFYGLFLYSM